MNTPTIAEKIFHSVFIFTLVLLVLKNVVVSNLIAFSRTFIKNPNLSNQEDKNFFRKIDKLLKRNQEKTEIESIENIESIEDTDKSKTEKKNTKEKTEKPHPDLKLNAILTNNTQVTLYFIKKSFLMFLLLFVAFIDMNNFSKNELNLVNCIIGIIFCFVYFFLRLLWFFSYILSCQPFRSVFFIVVIYLKVLLCIYIMVVTIIAMILY
jgi:hypothetical protein